jgi:hypothetical protein
MNLTTARKILSEIKYRDMTFSLKRLGPISDPGGIVELELTILRSDSVTEKPSFVKASTKITNRAFKIMLEEVFVKLVFNAILDFEVHEAGEFFKYNNKALFNPHKAVNQDFYRAEMGSRWKDNEITLVRTK